jgi:hypothetical protein
MLFRYDFLPISSAATAKKKTFVYLLPCVQSLREVQSLPQAFDCMQFNLVPFAAAQFNCVKPTPTQAGRAGRVYIRLQFFSPQSKTILYIHISTSKYRAATHVFCDLV